MIETSDLKKNFGDLKVLTVITQTIKQGEKVVIIGPSGSGKSTLLRCMNLLEEPSSGEIWLDGQLISAVDENLHPEMLELDSKRAIKKATTTGTL